MRMGYEYIVYTLPNAHQTKIIQTSRPDSYDCNQVQEFLDEFKPKVRFKLTDDKDRKDQKLDIPTHWHVWRPCHPLTVEAVYACLSEMNDYVQTPGNIWMHCDSSSQRAPTFFGLFLNVFFNEQKEEIVKDVKWNNPQRPVSNVLSYAAYAMESDRGVGNLITAWRDGDESAANSQLLKDEKYYVAFVESLTDTSDKHFYEGAGFGVLDFIDKYPKEKYRRRVFLNPEILKW